MKKEPGNQSTQSQDRSNMEMATGFWLNYTQTTSSIGFWQRENFRDQTIKNALIL